MVEKWKAVVGYEGLYEVSDLGRVRSLPRTDRLGRFHAGCVRKVQRNNQSGYLTITLGKSNGRGEHGSKLMLTLHRVVLEAFRGKRPKGKEARHLDGNKANCRLDNLEWATHGVNMKDQLAHGTRTNRKGEANTQARLTEDDVRVIRKRVAAGESQTDVAADFALAKPAVSNIVNRKRWAHVD